MNKKIIIFITLFIIVLIPTYKVEAKTLGDLRKELSNLEAKYEENKNNKKLTDEQIASLTSEINTITGKVNSIKSDIKKTEDDILKIEGVAESSLIVNAMEKLQPDLDVTSGGKRASGNVCLTKTLPAIKKDF